MLKDIAQLFLLSPVNGNRHLIFCQKSSKQKPKKAINILNNCIIASKA